jgi:hypothetical protein
MSNLIPLNKQKQWPRPHTWAIYNVKDRPAKLVGVVNAPNKQTAIGHAIEAYQLPANERSRLMALRKD